MNGMLLSGKREFDYEQEEKFFLSFMRLVFIIFALVFAWSIYSHCKQINLSRKGTAVLAEVQGYSGGERITYVAEDGLSYGHNISGMFLPEHEDTIMVYYLDNPAAAMPLTKVSFFYILYAVSIVGMGFAAWQIKRMKKSMC